MVCWPSAVYCDLPAPCSALSLCVPGQRKAQKKRKGRCFFHWQPMKLDEQDHYQQGRGWGARVPSLQTSPDVWRWLQSALPWDSKSNKLATAML